MGKKKQQTTKQHKPRPQKPRVQSGLAAESSDPQATTVALNGLTLGSLAGQPSARPLRQAAVMQMQRQNGNAGVRRRLEQYTGHAPIARRRADHGHSQPATLTPSLLSRLRIQRFISSEHQSLGDVTGETIPANALFPGSPDLSYGEIVALSGDLYGSYQHLASPNYILADGQEDTSPGSTQRKIAELNELKNLLRVEGALVAQHRAANGGNASGFYPEGLDTGYVTDPATGVEVRGFELATGGRYGQLALENFLHFSFGEENVNAWKEGHKQALKEAFLAGVRQDAAALVPAIARNAAANHYLTDAFSSGHMRVPRRCADDYYRQLMVNTVDGMVEALVNAMPEDIDFSIPLSSLGDYLPSWAPDLPDIDVDIPLPLQDWMRAAAGSLADALRPSMNEPVGQALGGLISKWLHDKENERGLCVSNQAGGLWQAYGDTFLDQPGAGTGCEANTTNRAEAQKAVLADLEEVRRLFAAGQAEAADRVTPAPIPSAVYFSFDTPRGEGDVSAINADGRQSLDALAAYLQTTNGVTVSLTGWADSRGSKEYNEALSTRRISAVRAYLEGQGVAADKLGGESPMGEPLAPTSVANHHEFRRVDITLVGTPTPVKPNGDGQEAPGDTAFPPEIEGPFAAEQFLPHVESNNPVLEPYEWCEITDATLKNDVCALAREMVEGLLIGKVTKIIYDHLDNYGPYEVEIPVPLVDNPTITIPRIPIRDWASDVVMPVIGGAVDHVLTDSVFTGLMDGACSLAANVPEVESDAACP